MSFKESGHVIEVSKNDSLREQLPIPPIYETWDEIYDCLSNFICDAPFWMNDQDPWLDL